MSMPANSYIGRHAELYDLFYAEKPYADEAAFVHRCIQAQKPGAKRLLELACGTGTHSLLMEKFGYKIVATDYSADMLTRAGEKGRAANSAVDFRQQDMCALDVPERPFDVVVCLFDSIGYVATNENILRVLKDVHRHLADDGIFLFEFWHGGAMLKSYDPVRVRRFQTPHGKIERISETRVDYAAQLCYVTYTINELNADGSYQTLREKQVNRFFLVQEMSLFLWQSGLTPVKWFSGFSENEHIDAETWHIVAIARKGTAK